MEARPKLNKGCDPALRFYRARARNINSGNNLQNRAFPGSVAADDSDDFSACHLEGNSLKRLELIMTRTVAKYFRERLAKRVAALSDYPEPLHNTFEQDAGQSSPSPR